MSIDIRNAKLLAAAKAAIKAGDLPKAQNYLLMAEGEEAEKLLDRVNKAIAARGGSSKAKTAPAAESIKEGMLAYEQERFRRGCLVVLVMMGAMFACLMFFVMQANIH